MFTPALKSTPCKVEESAPAGPVPDLTIASPPPPSLLSRLGRRSWTSLGPRNVHNRTMADSSVASDSSVEVSRDEGKLCEEPGEVEEEQGSGGTSAQDALLQPPGQTEPARLVSEDGEVFLTPSAVSTPSQAFFERKEAASSPRARLAPLAPVAHRSSLPAAGAAQAREVAELAARVLATAPTFPGRSACHAYSSLGFSGSVSCDQLLCLTPVLMIGFLVLDLSHCTGNTKLICLIVLETPKFGSVLESLEENESPTGHSKSFQVLRQSPLRISDTFVWPSPDSVSGGILALYRSLVCPVL